MKRFLKLLAALMVAVATARADEITAHATLSPDKLTPGTRFRIEVAMDLPSPWHANANPPSDKSLIPTTLTWNVPASVVIDRVTYPAGKSVKLEWSDKPVSLYEGRVVIVTEGRVREEAGGGALKMEGKLRYQACDNETCQPPKTVPVMVEAEITGKPVKVVAPAVNPPDHPPGWSPNVQDGRSFWGMLAAAFLGGLLLNLMPCVLPVISLKILGFVQDGASRRNGLLYGAGVLVSFWVLAAVVIGLKLAGRQVGWGFQFQDARFVLAMALLCTVIALSLFGVFEFGVGGKTMESAAKLAGRGAFFNGALAVLLATPCTAPFLAPALGLAFAQSPTVIFAVLTAVALGLALPYVVLAWNERWLRWLPKPGAWLTSFKQLMGFPMLAVAVWLAWVAGAPRGGATVAMVMGWLLAAAFLVWLAATLRPGRFVWILVAVALAAGLAWWKLAPRKPLIEWQPYSKTALAEALKTSKPVFVDFTADWCLTCQVNKRVAIETKVVADRFRKLGVIPLLADWTQPNPEIDEALRAIGRSGVPAYVVYPADRSKPPVVLTEVLRPGVVLNALEEASR